MNLFPLASGPVFMDAVQLDQALESAAVLLEDPGAFHCAAPAGGEGEVLESVFSEGLQGCDLFVDCNADVDELGAALLHLLL